MFAEPIAPPPQLSTLERSAEAYDAEILLDGDRIVAEYALNGLPQSGGNPAAPPIRRYVHGPGVDEPLVMEAGSARTWLHADRQGSIIAWSNAAGQAVVGQTSNTATYSPYGEPSGWSVPRFGYTGQAAWGEVELWYYKARIYHPALGRFLQTDPVGYDAGDTNLYAYVGGDPGNKTDPTGRYQSDGCELGCSGRSVPQAEGSVQKPRIASQTPVDRVHQLSGQPAAGAGAVATPEVPKPPTALPGGPYEPAGAGQRGGAFFGPKQPSGPRSQLQWVPPEAQGGPSGSTGYWKVKTPGQPGWQRFSQSGQPITPEQAHPGKPDATPAKIVAQSARGGPTVAFVVTLLVALFWGPPAY